MLLQIDALNFFVFLTLLLTVLDVWRFREKMLLLHANQILNAGIIEVCYSLLAVRSFFAFRTRFCILNFDRITVEIL